MSAPGMSTIGYERRAKAVSNGSVITRFVAGHLTSLGPREFRGIAATDALCVQDNVALVMSGGDLSRLNKLSWNHEDPIGTITQKTATANQILVEASFAPPGVDDAIDRLCAKVKGGVPMDLSMQFIVLESEPIRPGRPDLGTRATKWQALEVALVLVGADPGARITARKSRKSGVSMSAIYHCQTALDEHAAFARHHAEIADATQRLDEHRSRLGTALRGLHAAVQAGDSDTAADCHARCMRCMGGMNREIRAIGDRHQDATDAYNAVQRALRSAGEAAGWEVGTQPEPTAGSASSHEQRARDLDLAALRLPPDSVRPLSQAERMREMRMVDVQALKVDP
ncbi:MAG TPA: hypothetical protein VHW95_00020 [Steroidobacteraceae bacterium]|jgi:hypothetical protein|nr:hypothetical protein [Steroidobacteraceae bacterium]